MSSRLGTYVAYHADSGLDPLETERKYHDLLRAWRVREEQDFSFIHVAEKVQGMLTSAARVATEATLKERMQNAQNMLLIVGAGTKHDLEWIPFEIAYAVEHCRIPIIAAYLTSKPVLDPKKLQGHWPIALADRIRNQSARVIHVPFLRQPVSDALSQFSLERLPSGTMSVYGAEAYRQWGIAA